ncbi:ATP-binding protein [Candidatus Poribacteria bacterium]
MCGIACGTELKIQSDMIYLRPVRAFVRKLAESAGFCHEKASDIEIAVDEIFTNAVEHGSADTGSPVTVQCLSTDEMIEVTVSDTGTGESDTSWISAWPDVVKKEVDSHTEKGRGLLLAHKLTDEMSMEPNLTGGINVHLVIYKGGSK